MRKESPLLYLLKPDGSSPHCHSGFCSKLVETKPCGTVRAGLITIETSGDVTRSDSPAECGPLSNPYANVTEFKYLGMTLTNQNCKQEKNCGERSVNACCRSVNAFTVQCKSLVFLAAV